MVVVQSVILMKLQTKFYHMRDITCREMLRADYTLIPGVPLSYSKLYGEKS